MVKIKIGAIEAKKILEDTKKGVNIEVKKRVEKIQKTIDLDSELDDIEIEVKDDLDKVKVKKPRSKKAKSQNIHLLDKVIEENSIELNEIDRIMRLQQCIEMMVTDSPRLASARILKLYLNTSDNLAEIKGTEKDCWALCSVLGLLNMGISFEKLIEITKDNLDLESLNLIVQILESGSSISNITPKIRKLRKSNNYSISNHNNDKNDNNDNNDNEDDLIS